MFIKTRYTLYTFTPVSNLSFLSINSLSETTWSPVSLISFTLAFTFSRFSKSSELVIRTRSLAGIAIIISPLTGKFSLSHIYNRIKLDSKSP